MPVCVSVCLCVLGELLRTGCGVPDPLRRALGPDCGREPVLALSGCAACGLGAV
jgi:hypothetical protein